ncbi:MAG: DnaD domain protein [Firmicutes bacterium]|nr:DnaD domain protein [Bacillota bacterium]
MARSRNIKPGFFMNDILAEIEPIGRLLFAGLWTIADREGRLEDRPKRIKAEVLPYDNCDINQLLNELQNHDFILRYQVDGDYYIQILNFSKHQNPHKNEAPSVIPEPKKTSENATSDTVPDNSGTSTVQAPDKHSTDRADSLNMIPDSLNMIPQHETSVPETLQSEFGRTVSPTEIEKLQCYVKDGMSDDVICEAIKRSKLQGSPKLSYVEGILKNWWAEEVRDMDGVERVDREFEKRRKERQRDGPSGKANSGNAGQNRAGQSKKNKYTGLVPTCGSG